MVIVYDLMSDMKVNLIHHQHEVQALAFSPPGAGNSNQAGEFLISVDYNSKAFDHNTVRKRWRVTEPKQQHYVPLELD
jgi:hypothetical protein